MMPKILLTHTTYESQPNASTGITLNSFFVTPTYFISCNCKAVIFKRKFMNAKLCSS